MADTSLWPVVVGGVLTGLFALGGIGVGAVVAARRDAAQERHEKAKRRADKFEELVAGLYEFDHWVDSSRQRDAYGVDIPQTVSPFAKVQSISSVYFPQFDEAIRELDIATIQYRMWIHTAAVRRIDHDIAKVSEGLSEAYTPYVQKRDALLGALKKFAHEEFQLGSAASGKLMSGQRRRSSAR
jgi:hypothetical protein